MAVAWASDGPEARGLRGGGAPPCQEEDEHVRRYMAAMEVRFSNTSQGLWGHDQSYDPVMVPSLWVSTARADTRRALGF